MKRISTFLFTAMLALIFSAGAVAQDRVIEIVKNGEIIYSSPAADIDYITVDVDYVDLGLPSGTKWAKCNLGASAPEEYGDFYGWGCTTPYKSTDSADWPFYFQLLGGSGSSSSDCGTDADPLKDYVYPNSKSIAGTKWDAATVMLGENWRMPTLDQVTELINSCSWEWTTENGKHGCKVTGPNGNYIFIPAAGIRWGGYSYDYVDVYGEYFCATSNTNNAFNVFALIFNSNTPSYNNNFRIRCDGEPIRPVYDPTPKVEYVDLGLSVKWATCNLGAATPEETGDYYGWGCTEPYKDTDYVDWTSYFQKLGGDGSSYSADDCGTDKDPLKDYIWNSIAGTEWDAARAKLGGTWRMPTKAEFEELRSNCTYTWDDDKKGFTVTGKNGNSIFLRAAGYHDTNNVTKVNTRGYYWGSTSSGNGTAYSLSISSTSAYWSIYNSPRTPGYTIRPVTE